MSIKIRSFHDELINGKYALNTEPPLTPDLFEEMRRILADKSPIAERTPLLDSMCLDYDNGRLLFASLKPDAYQKQCIQNLLDLAEKNLAARRAETKKRETKSRSDEDDSIRDAAGGFRIPIE